MKNIISNSNEKIKCPRCNSHKIYKFGKNPKTGNQKYQCQNCKYQSTFLDPVNLKPKKDYPKCPVCGSATYLHHDYKFYSNYSCRKCKHSVFIIKPNCIDDVSSSNLLGKSNFKRLRFPLFIVMQALMLFYVCNSPARKISRFLHLAFNVKVSHVTICKWIKCFAPIFQQKSFSYLSNLDFNSDEWHIDETCIKINGVKYWIWFVIDSETRFIISFHISKERSEENAAITLFNASKLGKPSSIVSDRLPGYNVSVKSAFPDLKHIKVQSFADDITNNLIESFNKTFKSWYKSKLGFKSFDSANNMVFMFVYFYNFINPHSSLNNLAPAQVAGAEYSEKDKQNLLLAS